MNAVYHWQPGQSTFVVQAFKHKVQFRFGQCHSFCERGAFQLAPELDNLALRMVVESLNASSDRTRNRALPVGFAATRRTIPN